MTNNYYQKHKKRQGKGAHKKKWKHLWRRKEQKAEKAQERHQSFTEEEKEKKPLVSSWT